MGAFRTVSGHTLLQHPLGRSLTVVDLGANHGRFSNMLATDHSGDYYAVEANPELTAELERQHFRRVIACAVTSQEGPVALNLSTNDEGSSILPRAGTGPYGGQTAGTVSVPGRTISNILRDIPGRIDVLKIDVEGAEMAVLPTIARSDLARIAQITVEFHGQAFGFAGAGSPRDAIRLMRRRGFVALAFAEAQTDVLFLNRALLGVTAVDALRWRVQATRARWSRQRLGAWLQAATLGGDREFGRA